MLKEGGSVLFGALLVVTLGTNAEAVQSAKGPEWVVLNSGDSGTEVAIEIPEVVVEEVGQSFHVVKVWGAGLPDEGGGPETPVMARLVAVPAGVMVDVEIESCEYAPLTGIRLKPYREKAEGDVPDEGVCGEDRFCGVGSGPTGYQVWPSDCNGGWSGERGGCCRHRKHDPGNPDMFPGVR